MDQKNINFVVKEGSTVTEISLGSKYRWRKGGRRGGEEERGRKGDGGGRGDKQGEVRRYNSRVFPCL